MSRTDLVEHLYDQDFDRDSNTIEVFIGRLRKKLDANLIQTVRVLGHSLEDPAPWDSSIFRLNSLRRPLDRGGGDLGDVALAVGCFVLSNAFRNAVQGNYDSTLVTDMDGVDRGCRA